MLGAVPQAVPQSGSARGNLAGGRAAGLCRRRVAWLSKEQYSWGRAAGWLGSCCSALRAEIQHACIMSSVLPSVCLQACCPMISHDFPMSNWASRDSRVSAVGCCLVFLSVSLGPRGTLGLELRILSGLSVCHFQASRDSGAVAVGDFLVSLCEFSSLEGLWGFSCRVLSGLSACQARASRDSGVPPVK